MKILHLRNSDIYSSPERLIIGQCLNLPEFEFVCASFVHPDRDNRFLEECHRQGIKTVGLRDSFPGDVRLVGRLRRIILEEDIDLVVTHDYKASFYTFFARRKLAVKQVAYFHGVTSEDFKVKVYNAVDRQVLKRLKHVIAVSEKTSELLADMGVDPINITVVPNAIDGATLVPADWTPPEPAEKRRIVAAGRFSFEKGFDLLLQAIARVRKSREDFTLYLYGTGPEESKLRQLTGVLDLEGTVEFCGFSDDLLPVLRGMDFLVMPSRSEGMPVTVLEAWSQQLGLIATSVGGVPEIVEDGRNGLLVPPEDVQALADKIVYALGNPPVMCQLGRRGFDRVKEKHTYAQQAVLLRKVYLRT